MRIPHLRFLTTLPAIALTTVGFAQKPLHVTHGFAYKTTTEETDFYPFEPTIEADHLVSGISSTLENYINEKGELLYDGCLRPQLSENSTPKKLGPESSISKNMVFVQGGTFTMGCKDGRDKACEDSEKPAHSVKLPDFYLGKYEVTQAEWTKIMGNNPSNFKHCDNCPVENVTWDDVQEFIKKLNAQNPGKAYRLPTEAEWEFAARGGNLSKDYAYSGSNTLFDVGWFYGNSNSKTHSVGGLKANELNLFDMTGNVSEWCADDWHDDFKGAPSNSRAWLDNPRGSYRVIRGGSWYDYAEICPASRRHFAAPVNRNDLRGFRLASSSR